MGEIREAYGNMGTAQQGTTWGQVMYFPFFVPVSVVSDNGLAAFLVFL